MYSISARRTLNTRSIVRPGRIARRIPPSQRNRHDTSLPAKPHAAVSPVPHRHPARCSLRGRLRRSRPGPCPCAVDAHRRARGEPRQLGHQHDQPAAGRIRGLCGLAARPAAPAPGRAAGRRQRPHRGDDHHAKADGATGGRPGGAAQGGRRAADRGRTRRRPARLPAGTHAPRQRGQVAHAAHGALLAQPAAGADDLVLDESLQRPSRTRPTCARWSATTTSRRSGRMRSAVSATCSAPPRTIRRCCATSTTRRTRPTASTRTTRAS